MESGRWIGRRSAVNGDVLSNVGQVQMPPSADPIVDVPERVRWWEIALFSSLAYAISWAWWAQLVVPRLGSVSLDRPMPDLTNDPALTNFAFGMFGPMIAAIIMRLFVSKEGLRDSVGVVRPWRWYAIALVAPPAFVAIVILVGHLSNLGPFVWTRELPVFVFYPLVVLLNAAIVLPVTFGEEYGWRGYLLPKLLPLGEVKATLMVGAIWGTWHLPAIIVGLNYPGEPPWVALLLFAITTLLLAFPFTWLWIASRSVLIAAIAHATLNAATDGFVVARYIPEGRPIITGGGGVIMIGLLATLVLVVQLSRLRRRSGRRAAGVHRVSLTSEPTVRNGSNADAT